MGGEPAQPTSYKSAAEMHTFVLSQLDSVVATSTTLDDTMNMITVLGNVSALLFYAYNAVVDPDAKLQHLPVNWVGFYLLNGAQTLALGPFQGRVACTKIKVGRGVCGGAALQGKSLVVRNVHEYPGHIACDGDSNSEIVVVIRAPEDNRVVGVLDIDSTQVGQFNDEDLAFLEKVVAVVAARIKFPFRPPTRPLGDADKPAAVVGNAAPTNTASPAVVSVSTPHVAHHLPTDSTAIPSLDVIPPPVVPEVRRVAGWEFQTTQQQRIQTQEEQESMTKNLAVHAIPEIAFPVNALRIVGKGGLLALHFDCFSVLRDAARFYSADHDRYLAHIADDVRIPVGESWKNSQYSTFDAKIDWAWRHEYFGFDAAAAALVSSLSSTTSTSPPPPSLQLKESVDAQIDWELLRRTDLPILQYVNIPLFEDDLHDHGLVLCTVKARVMESCFFVLLRHVVHVHGSGTSIRDVRVFHKFNLSSSSDDVVVVEEQVRRYHVDATTSNDKKNENWSMETVDILAPQVPLVYTKNYYLTAASSTA